MCISSYVTGCLCLNYYKYDHLFFKHSISWRYTSKKHISDYVQSATVQFNHVHFINEKLKCQHISQYSWHLQIKISSPYLLLFLPPVSARDWHPVISFPGRFDLSLRLTRRAAAWYQEPLEAVDRTTTFFKQLVVSLCSDERVLNLLLGRRVQQIKISVYNMLTYLWPNSALCPRDNRHMGDP